MRSFFCSFIRIFFWCHHLGCVSDDKTEECHDFHGCQRHNYGERAQTDDRRFVWDFFLIRNNNEKKSQRKQNQCCCHRSAFDIFIARWLIGIIDVFDFVVNALGLRCFEGDLGACYTHMLLLMVWGAVPRQYLLTPPPHTVTWLSII